MKKRQPYNDDRSYAVRRQRRIARQKSKENSPKNPKKTMGKEREEGSKMNQLLGVKENDFHIVLPENFNLTENYGESMRQINTLRECINSPTKRKRTYIDFDDIRSVGPGAALVLAAELDVCNTKYKKMRWRIHPESNWDPEVQMLLREMGFHQLLKLRSHKNQDKSERDSDLSFFQFQSGLVCHRNVTKTLSGICDSINAKYANGDLPNDMILKEGVGEAVLNTRQHAYAKEHKQSLWSKWWLSASHQKSTNEIKVICYDKGASIPDTLPIKRPKLFQDIFSRGKTKDFNVIEKALKEPTSQTEKEYRGKGLLSMKDFINESDQGKLIVLSRNGKVTYVKSPGREPEFHSDELPVPINGTLIIWSIIPI